jgi:heterodisulfide reductase subunit A
VISAVRQMAIQAGFSSPIETVTVDETACSGCGICGMACPYEAPSLVEKMVNGQMDRVSDVDENRCRGCGICVAACPTGAISRPGVSNQEIIDQTIFSKSSNGDPRMVVFICDWCLRAAADEKILESYPENVRIIHIPCSGRIDPEIALRALNSGIDGVMICGCKPGECHFKRGNLVNACKIGTLDLMFDDMGLGEKRVNFVQIGTLERGRVRKEVDSMLEKLTARKEIQQ